VLEVALVRIYRTEWARDMAYPTNVLHMATESSNKNHSAVFPVSLPEWFIKLFTAEGDVVLDPFMGLELRRWQLGV
jgi:DNA modification methylase